LIAEFVGDPVPLRDRIPLRDRSDVGAHRPHSRPMPVFLKPENFGTWLDGSAGPELLKPANENLLQVWPVSKRVNRPGNDKDVSLVEPIEVACF
jgi:putative SOS response-associated peptidase YedK